MNMKPVTIIIPAWNRPDLLRGAFKSLVAQTNQEFEVLVSDDCGEINLKEVCDEFKDLLTIHYIRSDVNRGCGGNRNFAFTHFLKDPSEYFMFMDSDDALMPQCISRLLWTIEQTHADIVFSDIVVESFGERTNIHQAGRNETWLHGKIYRTAFAIAHNINFPKKLATNEDLAFNLSMMAYDPQIHFLHEQVYLWRQTGESVCRRSDDGGAAKAKCDSVDYIDSIYEAWTRYPINKLTSLMIVNVLNCYNHYQLGKAWGYLTDRHEKRIKEMLHHPSVQEAIVQLPKRTDFMLQLQGWIVKGENLMFFSQTFGQWLMQYFTQAEIAQMVQKYS